MSNLLQEIEAQISGVKTSVNKQNVGIVRECSDGVAKIEGLTDCMANEMLDFGGGVIGLALNLEETEVGAIILGDYLGVHEGSEVKTTGKLLSVPVGKGLLGRVVDCLGRPVDGKGPIKEDAFYPVEKIAPGIIKRKSVSQPVQTGIMAIDAMIPIGRGQRELIIGDRSTGKTTIGVDTMINQSRMNKVGRASGDTSPSARSSRTSRASSLNWKKPVRSKTRLSWPPLLLIPLRINISPPSPVLRWANGSWITAWMR